jgi:hypothetical protein
MNMLMRELSVEETVQVSGGDQVVTYYDRDAQGVGGTVTERWSDDGTKFFGMTISYDTGSAWDQDWFICAGMSVWVGAGFCTDGTSLYGYFVVSPGEVPGLNSFDVTVGVASDSNSYLTGPGVSANGVPGAGVSLNPDGSVAASAWTFGTPGGGATFGFNISEAFKQIGRDISDGLYNTFGRPYDGPVDDGGGGGEVTNPN